MSGKSIVYWRQQWNSIQSKSFPEDIKNENVGRTLELLAKYACFFKSIPIFYRGAWGGFIGRFFSGRWNTHHGSAVQNAIADFYEKDGFYAGNSTFHSVEFILALVKREMGKNPIKKDGDLARILQVIKEQTKVNYYNLDENIILERFGKNSRSHRRIVSL